MTEEFDAVAGLRRDLAPTAAGRAGARQAVLDRIDAPRPAARPRTERRRVLAGVAAAAAVAAVAAGAVTLSQRTSRPAPVTAPTAAADPTPSSSAPASAPFTHVTTHRWTLVDGGLEGRDIRYQSEDEAQVWAPADWTQRWYFENRSNISTKFLTADDRDFVRAHDPELLRSETSYARGTDGLTDQDYYELCDPQSLCDPSWQRPTASFVASLPTDPTQLRTVLYAAAQQESDETVHYGKVDDVDSQAWEYVDAILDLGYLPADLQAAFRQVATTIPGVSTVDSETNLDGVTGVGLQRLDRYGDVRIDLMFTPGGAYLGSRRTVVSPDWDAHNGGGADAPTPTTPVPVGTVVGETSIAVDSVPAPPLAALPPGGVASSSS